MGQSTSTSSRHGGVRRWYCGAAAALIPSLPPPAHTLTAATAQCGSSSPFVGFEGALTGLEHDVGGQLRILDDCTAEVAGFTYDGNAPAAYWWGAPSTSNGDIRGQGRRIAQMRIDRAYDGETVRWGMRRRGSEWAGGVGRALPCRCPHVHAARCASSTHS